VSDSEGIIAHPLGVLSVRDWESAVHMITEAAAQRKAAMIVVGMPLNMNGSAGAKARETSAFVAALRRAVACEVKTWDERLTTVAAERVLRGAGLSHSKRKEHRDMVAAQMLLQNFLDAQRSRQTQGLLEEEPPDDGL
jgi:putative Holliday junction resolvase